MNAQKEFTHIPLGVISWKGYGRLRTIRSSAAIWAIGTIARCFEYRDVLGRFRHIVTEIHLLCPTAPAMVHLSRRDDCLMEDAFGEKRPPCKTVEV